MINEPCKEYKRPWGSYKTLALENGFQVKVLTILPGEKISLQKHAKRSEHWVVTQGIPTLTIGDTKKAYHPDQSVYIPKAVLHRIENLTEEICTVIEVQVGSYLGEDDIVRVDDVYGREQNLMDCK